MKPLDILNQWMKAVNQGDVDTLISLYDTTAILIPTFSNRILNTPEKIRVRHYCGNILRGASGV